MKNLLAIAAIFISLSCRANVIDSLKTEDDVRVFLKKEIINHKDKDYDPLGSDKPSSNGKMAKVKFVKVDLNGDGRTDLLINGDILFAVIDAGNGKFKVCEIDRGTFFLRKYALVNVDTGVHPKVIVQQISDLDRRAAVDSSRRHNDTLVMLYNGFVEANNYPADKNIKEISLSTSGCFGMCPVFELAVDTDGTAVYNAIKYNDQKGKMQCEIDKPTVDSLFGLANYIRPKLLENKYRVNWTDDQTATLTITFNDGTVKTISDYGMIGTFGVERLYEAISALRKTQHWEHQ